MIHCKSIPHSIVNIGHFILTISDGAYMNIPLHLATLNSDFSNLR